MSIASDGDAKRGKAFALLTFKKRLLASSPIFSLLSDFELFNYLVGDGDLTCDKDYKHLFKRLRNLILRRRGIVIGDVILVPAIIQEHLLQRSNILNAVSSDRAWLTAGTRNVSAVSFSSLTSSPHEHHLNLVPCVLSVSSGIFVMKELRCQPNSL